MSTALQKQILCSVSFRIRSLKPADAWRTLFVWCRLGLFLITEDLFFSLKQS